MDLVSSSARRSHVGLSKEKEKVLKPTEVMVNEDEWKISFGEKFCDACKDNAAASWKKVSIYKIPSYLIDPLDCKAYIPQTVSLGPYHHGKAHLQQMETHKWRALQQVLKRTGQNKELYLDSMNGLGVRARACYEGPLGQLNGYKFAELMLLDGCFILEILQGATLIDGFESLGYGGDDPIFSMRAGTMSFIRRDMIMLENQIPLFVLDELLTLQLGGSSSKGDLVMLAVRFFNPLIRKSHPDNGKLKERPCSEKLKGAIQTMLARNRKRLCSSPEAINAPQEPSPNLVDLQSYSQTEWELKKIVGSTPEATYAPQDLPSNPVDVHSYSESEPEEDMIVGCAPEALPAPQEPPPNQVDLHCLDVFRKSILYGKTDQQGASAPSASNNNVQQLIHCATELKDAGIKFRKQETGMLWDIYFKNGILYIPPILIHDGTKSLLFNLIAFEQCHPTCRKDITTYVIFLDNLINSAEDVKYLHYHGIIEHWLGSDAEVADLINCLGREVVFFVNESYFSQISEDINKYYGKTWHTWRAILKERYFNNPWAIISFVAAVLLLIMTAAQSFYAVYSYYWPNN